MFICIYDLLFWGHSHQGKATSYKRYCVSLADRLGMEPNLPAVSGDTTSAYHFWVNSIIGNNVNH